MSKNLVIVESPAKAKTIGRYLGNDFQITASVGHIRDIPSNQIGVQFNNNFKPLYVTMEGKEKVIKELKKLASESDFVYIATDPDREGEAIAWHIAQVLKIDPASQCRITFNEITRKTVLEAINSPRSIDMDLVNAQQARRILDRIVGYELSPLLWKKIKKGLSAGRVQSVAAKIVMDRDAEIDAFIPEEYWLVDGLLTPDTKAKSFKVKYQGRIGADGKFSKNPLSNGDEASAIVEKVTGKDFICQSVKKGKKDRNPAPPFTTSTLQQEASKRLGFPSRKTMSVAQQLYEGVQIDGIGQTALVSYIRTDSVRISDEAVNASRALIKEKYGDQYICPYIRTYKNKNSAQDAHEAIRPTHFDLAPEQIKSSLSNDQYKLYKMIWDRFLSTQMAPAVINTVSLDAVCEGEVFRTSGETVVFPGFLAAYADVSEDKDEEQKEGSAKLPELTEGQVLKNLGITSEQKFTMPPAHYTEATLIKFMEENGIGRPSTYASIISTILDRKYVEKEGKALKITEIGKIVTQMLEANFENIVDVGFTAGMEEQLDQVESGNEEWTDLLGKFYPDFHNSIKEADEKIEKIKIEAEQLDEICPECGNGNLVYRDGRNGKRFIGCSCYPACTYKRSIEVKAKGKCPLCGSGLLIKTSPKYRGKSFYVCDKKGTNPDCGFISWDLPIEDRKCEVCNSFMVWKRYRGKTYPKCGNRDCETNNRKKKSGDSEDGDK